MNTSLIGLKRLGLVVATMTMLQTAGASVISNNFDTDPLWTGVNNTSGGNSYGYSGSTSFAGGSAGEVGGTFARLTAESYYADTFLDGHGFSAGGNATLGHTFQASGKFDIRNVAGMNNLVQIGYRSASTTDRSFLGLAIQENSANDVRIRAWVTLANGQDLFSGAVIVATNADYWFGFDYDPNAGVNSQGRLSLTVTNSLGMNSFLVDLTAANRTVGGLLDAFGVGSYVHDTAFATLKGDVFIDDVMYTAIPEPTAAALLGMGCVIFLRHRRSK